MRPFKEIVHTNLPWIITAFLFSVPALFFPDLPIEWSLLIAISFFIFVCSYLTRIYIYDLKKLLDSKDVIIDRLSREANIKNEEFNKLRLNRDQVVRLLKERDLTISEYEKLINEINLAFTLALTDANRSEKTQITNVKQYLYNQIGNIKERLNNYE